MSTPARLSLPAPAAPPGRRPFPVLATVAPVAVSLAMWLITGSVFALLFAALGPAVAIASVGDAALHGRRTARRQGARYRAQLEALRGRVAERHAEERSGLEAAHPGFRSARVPPDWRASGGAHLVRLGVGARASALEIDAVGMPDVEVATTRERTRGRPSRAADAELARSILERARTLQDAPIVVDAAAGIGVAGPAHLVGPVVRGLVAQLARSYPPLGASIEVAGPDARRVAAELAALPHEVRVVAGAQPVISFVASRDGGSPLTAGSGGLPGSIASASTVSELPPWFEVRLSVGVGVGVGVGEGVDVDADAGGPGGGAGVLERLPTGVLSRTIRTENVSAAEFAAAAGFLAERARGLGMTATAAEPPPSATRDDLPPAPGTGELTGEGRGGAMVDGLRCWLGVGAHGPEAVDLVRDGPHAIVGGTTGSGKSELLIAWILAMAESRSPAEVTFLLVDFKGGAAFAGLEALPHCVGLLSDLDESTASRALGSLAAEVRHRERVIARGGARAIDDLEPGSLPRLVIVVDEFAAMVSGFPDLHALVSDLAARGRSLGIHLILCTQRPAGVVRDAVLANSGLRMSLRVNNRSDSVAVIGTDAAARLGSAPAGRVLIARAGAEPVAAQVPLVRPADVAAIATSWSGRGASPRRPWREPLPSVITLASVLEEAKAEAEMGAEAGPTRAGTSAATTSTPTPGRRLPFARADLPHEQAQPVVAYAPAADGSLLVVGAPGSGKSTLLDTLAAAAATSTAASAEGTATGESRGAGAGPDVVRAAPGVESTWDAVAGTLADIRGARSGEPGGTVLLLDDVDVTLARLGDEHRVAFTESLSALLREGPAAKTTVVLTTQRLTGALQQLSALCDSRLLLRLPSRQDLVLAGGTAASFDPALPPGGGLLLPARPAGPDSTVVRVQVATSVGEPAPAATPVAPAAAHADAYTQTLDLVGMGTLAVVTRSPRAFADRARASHPTLAIEGAVVELSGNAVDAGRLALATDAPGDVILVGDAEAWQSRWGALAALAATSPVLLEGCTIAEYRALTKSREMPPPIVESVGAGWLRYSSGEVVRAVVAPAAAHAVSPAAAHAVSPAVSLGPDRR